MILVAKAAIKGPVNAVLWAAFCCLALIGCSPSVSLESLSGPTMGTRWAVTLANPGNSFDQAALQASIQSVLDTVNREMSTYDPNSEISQFNGSNVDGAWFPVSARFSEVTAQALGFARISQGAFDPTVGPLVNLWGFGPDATPDDLPSDAMIQAARSQVGYEAIAVRAPEEGAAIRKSAERRLDLSAIAKGAGVDAVAEFLIAQGYRNFLVDIGGEIRAVGQKDGRGWRVAVEKPVKNVRDVQQIIALNDLSVATSGDYRNYREIGGISYSHTIDPTTGRPVTHNLASVSVADASCTTADGWATTFLVLGPDAGPALAEQRGIAALFIVRRDDGFDVHETSRWSRLFEEGS